MEIAIVYVTARDREQALLLSRTLLEEELIACANILDGMTSVYRWNDEVHVDSETSLLLKTRPSAVARLTDRIKELHSYECPCVVVWTSAAGNPDYFQWVHAGVPDPAD